MTSIKEHGGWVRALRLAAIPAIFTAVGPLIGLAILTAVAAGHAFVTLNAQAGVDMIFGGLVIGWLFAYLLGAAPALAAGVGVAAIAAAWRRVPLWAGGLVGLLVGLVAGFILDATTGQADKGPPPVSPYLGTAMVCAIASALCTRLTRRWH